MAKGKTPTAEKQNPQVLTLEQLKAAAYDAIAQRDAWQKKLDELNNVISQVLDAQARAKNQPPAPPAAPAAPEVPAPKNEQSGGETTRPPRSTTGKSKSRGTKK